MPTREAGRLLDLAQAYRDALEDQNQAAVDRITRSWARAMERLELEVQTLESKIRAARAAGVEVSPAWLYQERRLSSFVEAVDGQVRLWAPHAEEAIRDAAYAAARSARAGAEALTIEAVANGPLGASFTDLAPENMATILGHLAPGGPLRDLLTSLSRETVEEASQALVNGVLLGKGSDWIARELRRTLDIPRWRAESIARTEALRAYRETSRLTYQSSGVVAGWVWTSALDRRTCPACLVLHGEEFTLEEHLDGHPRCRCAMVPFVRPLAIQKGKDWLALQTPVTQRAILGPRKYDLWKDGTVDLDDMVARTHSPEWGTMRRERSALEMLEGRNANWRDTA